jgi:3-deoxy-D-manno-octulosonic-acid transferase
MKVAHLAYKLGVTALAAALIPTSWLHHRLRGKNSTRFQQRLGGYSKPLRQSFRSQPRLWLHAVSVGEVGVAAAILAQVKTPLGSGQVGLSTTTEQGFIRAGAVAPQRAVRFYAPIDLDRFNRKALAMVKPKVLALLETEIWPNLIVAAQEMGVRVAIVNGRISVRTIKAYRRILPLMRHTLSHVDAFSMISDEDAERIRSLGAPAHRIVVNGNAKFDGCGPPVQATAVHWARTLYSLSPEAPVIVAGSTRSPEEQMVLSAYATIRRAFPETVLILAPRHVERCPQIEQWVSARGMQSQRRSQLSERNPRRAPIVILDTIGELADTYGVASFVFCGGSLVPKGGQNLIEPAVWGKAVICGPSMEDFQDAHAYIQGAGGSVTVENSALLAEAAVHWLTFPDKAEAAGRAARNALRPHRGAALRHAAVIDRLLNDC